MERKATFNSKKKSNNRQPVYVTVLSKNGKVMEPTNRCGHVRYLLKTGKAKVVRSKPFTIQLLYDTEEAVQGEVLGIDPGRTNIGLSTVRKDGKATGRFHVTTRNKDVPVLMKARAEFRRRHRDQGRRDKRQRRAVRHSTFVKNHSIDRILPGCSEPIHCKEIRNKEARFNNRSRPEGWLTPTARHLLETHLHVVDKIISMRPVTDVVIEINKFAFMGLQAKAEGKELNNIDYQHGPLFGYEDVEDAVFRKQEGKCLLCGRKQIDHYHHIVPRHENGSNTIGNIAGICMKCHDLIHKDEAAMQRLTSKKAGMKKQFAGTSVLNQIIPSLITKLAEKHPDITVHLTTGQETKAFRELNGLNKEHDIDAYCIACSALDITEDRVNTNVRTQEIMQFRRQDRQCCHQEMTDRKYYLDGKLVATNRHKRMEQKTDSLEEYRKTHTAQEISRLKVKPHPPIYKDRKRVMPGTVMLYTEKLSKAQSGEGVKPRKKRFVMQRSDGKHGGKPDYYVSTAGERFPAGRCKVATKNKGIVFV